LGYDGTVVKEIRAAKEEASAKATRDAADKKFLQELASIMDRRGPALPGADELQSDTATDAAFAEAFGSLEDATETLRKSSHTETYVGHLAFWRWLRKVKLAAPDWEGIDALIRRIDPDNGPLHDALVADDAARLVAITEGADDLPLVLAAQVGLALAGEPGQESGRVTSCFTCGWPRWPANRATSDFRCITRRPLRRSNRREQWPGGFAGPRSTNWASRTGPSSHLAGRSNSSPGTPGRSRG